MRKLGPKIRTYDTLDDCFDAYTCGRVRRCDLINGNYSDGSPYTMYVRTFLKRRRKLHCWGFYDRRENKVHLWFDKKVKMINLLELISHELQHSNQSKHTASQWREKNAGDVAQVTLDAVGLMVNLFRLKTKRCPSVSSLGHLMKLKFK